MKKLINLPIFDSPELSGIINQSPDNLKPWPNNPRTHSEKQLVKLKASIHRFGFTAPVLIDELNVILSGHGRVQAAKELGLLTIPTRLISGLSETKKRAYVIADNKLSQLSGWDNNLLKSEMEILINEDFDIEITGFSTAEIDIMMDGSEEPVESNPDNLRPEDIVVTAVSQQGDLWQLGNHLLLSGDALNPDCYKMLMQGELAQMVITDPPYNVKIKGHVCGSGQIQHKEFAMASGEMSTSEFTNFLNKAFQQIFNTLQDGAIVYSFMDWRHASGIVEAANQIFGTPRQLCVWVKDNGGMGTFYRSQHELVYVFKKGKAPHINNFELGQHGRYRTNVWNYPGVNTFKGKGFELLALHYCQTGQYDCRCDA